MLSKTNIFLMWLGGRLWGLAIGFPLVPRPESRWSHIIETASSSPNSTIPVMEYLSLFSFVYVMYTRDVYFSTPYLFFLSVIYIFYLFISLLLTVN